MVGICKGPCLEQLSQNFIAFQGSDMGVGAGVGAGVGVGVVGMGVNALSVTPKL